MKSKNERFLLKYKDFGGGFMRQFKVKEVRDFLKRGGYSRVRCKGSHETWTNGLRSVTIPISKSVINPALALRLLKEHNFIA